MGFHLWCGSEVALAARRKIPGQERTVSLAVEKHVPSAGWGTGGTGEKQGPGV